VPSHDLHAQCLYRTVPAKTHSSYRLFGLLIASEFDLPLPPAEDGAVDVGVMRGSVDSMGELLWHAEQPFAFSCRRTDDAIVLDWPEAQFCVRPTQVVVDTDAPEAAIPLLLQPVWSIVLAARQRETLHGGVAESAGRSVGILGTSGAGKSTALLALLDRGWRLVSDDIISFDASGLVVPGPPFIRLEPDRADGKATELDPTGKFRYFPAFCPDPVRLTSLVVQSDEYVCPTRLSGVEAVGAVLAQMYIPMLTDPGQGQRRFDLAVGLVHEVPVYGVPPRSLTARALEGIVEEATR
jgi:hypothetical protein